MVILLLTSLFLAGVAFLFLTAEGDFTLMSKKHVKPHAFEDKVVWVTGASRGIGEALAQQLAGLGAKLILSSRNEAELERVKQQLTGKHAPSQVQVLPLDLTAGEAILREAVEKAESFFFGAGVDFMIHNAAFERPKSSALEMTEEGLKGMLDVNVRGTLSLTRLLAPYMLRRGSGHFIVVSSAAGKTPSPGQAVYSATKFALNGYFHALRSELCRKGIKVTIVCPGPIRTTTGRFTEKYLSTPRCAELTLIAASHGLKEAWISNQPVLAMMYLMQYMPSIGLYIMDQRWRREWLVRPYIYKVFFLCNYILLGAASSCIFLTLSLRLLPSLCGFFVILLHVCTIRGAVSGCTAASSGTWRWYADHMVTTVLTAIFQGSVSVLVITTTHYFLSRFKFYVMEDDAAISLKMAGGLGVLIFCLEGIVLMLAFFLKYYTYVEGEGGARRTAKVQEETPKDWPCPFHV